MEGRSKMFQKSIDSSLITAMGVNRHQCLIEIHGNEFDVLRLKRWDDLASFGTLFSDEFRTTHTHGWTNHCWAYWTSIVCSCFGDEEGVNFFLDSGERKIFWGTVSRIPWNMHSTRQYLAQAEVHSCERLELWKTMDQTCIWLCPYT